MIIVWAAEADVRREGDALVVVDADGRAQVSLPLAIVDRYGAFGD